MEKKAKGIILARVSSKEQRDSGYSLPAQERLLGEYANSNKITAKKTFTIAESASDKKQRETFNEMMSYLKESNINILIVEKIDRLTRNFKDAVEVDNWLNENPEHAVHFVKNGIKLTRDSRSQEKLNWGINVVIAKNFIDNLREEVYKGQQEKLLEGWLPAKAPIGYLNTGEEKRRIQIPDPATAPLVMKMFELYETGCYSTITLGAKMAELGLRSRNDRVIGRSATHKILTNKYYTGTIVWCGEEYPGKHTPIVDKALFERVQKKLSRPNPPKYASHPYTFRGAMKCVDCGGTITWETQKGIVYGHCNRYKECPKKPYAVEKDVQQALLEKIDNLRSPSQEIIEWTKAELLKKYESEHQVKERGVEQLQLRLSKMDTMLETLYDDRLEGRIGLETYDRKVKGLNEEKRVLQQNIEQAPETRQFDIGASLDLLDLTQKASEIYKTKAIDDKRKILNDLFSNLVLNGSSLLVEFKREAEIVFETVQKTKKLLATFEPQNKADLQMTNSNFDAMCSVWQG